MVTQATPSSATHTEPGLNGGGGERGTAPPSRRPASARAVPVSTPSAAVPVQVPPRRGGALVVAGIVALVLIALALTGGFGMIVPIGIVLLCGLMLGAMLFGMVAMPGMRGMRGMFGGQRDHGDADQPSVTEAGRPSGGAFAILGERYARGELTRAQYEQMRRDLGSRPVATRLRMRSARAEEEDGDGRDNRADVDGDDQCPRRRGA